VVLSSADCYYLKYSYTLDCLTTFDMTAVLASTW